VIALPAYIAAPEGADAAAQIRFIITHPFSYIHIVGRDFFIVHGWEYFTQWAALYGFGYWPVPTLTYILFIVSSIAVLFVREEGRQIDLKRRSIFFLVFLLCYAFTVTSLYMSYNMVGNQSIAGVQGRYFIPVMPLLYLCLANLPLREEWRLTARPVIVLISAAMLFYIGGMLLSYHVLCGSSYYQLGLCYQPVYKNWAPDDRYSPPISNALSLEQEIVSECSGMTELRIWVDSSSADSSSVTRFILRDPGTDSILADISARPTQLPTRDWYTLRFSPDWNSLGRLYVLEIRNETSGEIPGARISYSLEPEYLNGKLYENKKPVSQDIIFQYGCLAGLQKLISNQ
jgi:hypothetical protein